MVVARMAPWHTAKPSSPQKRSDIGGLYPGPYVLNLAPAVFLATRTIVGCMSLELFSPAVRDWFSRSFAAPTPAQVKGWPAIAAGDHTLILAPTGSGKTLSAFLWCLDRVLTEPAPPADRRCRVLYVSPLKALAVDVDRNLKAPLHGIGLAAERRGEALGDVTVGIRTGDTPAADRRLMAKHPPDILITTP